MASYSKITHQEAHEKCAADGASLPELTSAKDVDAMKHFMNKGSILTYAWTSLTKIDNSTECSEDSCDGLLQWSHGPTFTYDPSIYMPPESSAASFPVSPGHFCFRMGYKGKLMAASCDDTEAVICQYICPGK